jgi:hypothetical protein
MDLVLQEFQEALEAEAEPEELETQEDTLHLKVFQVQQELETALNPRNLIEVMVTLKMDKTL